MTLATWGSVCDPIKGANETDREDCCMGARCGNNHRAQGGPGEPSVQAAAQTGETSRNDEAATPTWAGGAAVGFLRNTPDGTALALNLHADRFLH